MFKETTFKISVNHRTPPHIRVKSK